MRSPSIKAFVVIDHGHEAIEVLRVVKDHAQCCVDIQDAADAGELVIVQIELLPKILKTLAVQKLFAVRSMANKCLLG